MSKQVKLKFKKMLKKAEFVHADLEYHEELLSDAKSEFTHEFNRITSTLFRSDDKREFTRLKNEIIANRLREQQEAMAERQREEEENQAILEETDKKDGQASHLLVTEEFPEGVELNNKEEETSDIKESDVKKLFYKIASRTHPDKLASQDLSAKELTKSEATFKQAKEAYENKNWYTLYHIGLDLDIDVGSIEDYHIEWIEQDIRSTMGRISRIGQLIAWIWYVGDKETRIGIMKEYFMQVYQFSWEPDPSYDPPS
jgi:hypothetical protein